MSPEAYLIKQALYGPLNKQAYIPGMAEMGHKAVVQPIARGIESAGAEAARLLKNILRGAPGAAPKAAMPPAAKPLTWIPPAERGKR